MARTPLSAADTVWLPGPAQRLYLAGRRLDRVMFWVPQSARLGLGVSIISYAGEVMVGVVSDAGLIPDPQRIVGGFEAELTRLVAGQPRRPPAGAAAARSSAGNRSRSPRR
jgi:hypothetical protein